MTDGNSNHLPGNCLLFTKRFPMAASGFSKTHFIQKCHLNGICGFKCKHEITVQDQVCFPFFSTDVQQMLVVEEAVPPERQQWISALDQESPEPPQIKEEPVELWTLQGGEQRPALEEAGFNLPFISVTVKVEDDVELVSQSSQFPEIQTEASREAELLKTEAGKDICGASASNFDPDTHFQKATRIETSFSESETDGESSSSSESESDGETSSSASSSESETDAGTPFCESQSGVIGSDWQKTAQPQSGSNCDLPVGDAGCVKGATRFGGKCFSCPVCQRNFSSNAHLVRHMRIHTGEKPFSCSVCGKKFALDHHMRRHLSVHTGEGPFSCAFCSRGFSHQSNLQQHVMIHTGERPFSCSVCGRGFTQQGSMTRHMAVHTGEKPFCCSLCGRGFTQHCSLKRHSATHRWDPI